MIVKANALVTLTRSLLILDGEFSGTEFLTDDRAPVGTEVRVTFCPDDQFASIVKE